MEMYEIVFNKASIYEMLFINVETVLMFSTIENLKNENNELFNLWKNTLKFKYNIDYDSNDEQTNITLYKKYAPYNHEFCKIIAITYANVFFEEGKINRVFKKIVSDNEMIIIEQFFDVLNEISSDGNLSSPKYFPILCGYNIINFDIPLLIKKHIKYRNSINNKTIPLILKNILYSKPWDSKVIDVINIWKFNGYDFNTSLEYISDLMKLKKNVNILPKEEISEYYWKHYDDNPQKEMIDFLVLQSAVKTNILIQFINELRQL